MLLGAVHALFLSNLLLQTTLLALLEVCFLGMKVVYLKASPVQFKFKLTILSLTSMLRLIFIFTFYLYHTEDAPAIINCIHHDVVRFYLSCWAIETLYDIMLAMVDFGKVVKKICRIKDEGKKGG